MDMIWMALLALAPVALLAGFNVQSTVARRDAVRVKVEARDHRRRQG